ncbi:hypothetical protein WJX72_005504 [[Myrmecia] bisecta]|uniref:Uncharacterized protein n=1 Tax=[Myrmecia] bisecta TaxID=41462 RepID=A0AAW1PGC9_9CHLO
MDSQEELAGLPVEEASTSGEQPAATEEQTRGQLKHGCTHYRRRCQLVAPCCGEVFWCRHCHNDAKAINEPNVSRRHDLDRTKVSEVICALCNTRQPAGTTCTECGVSFGVYTCLKCRFYDDDASKQQFHCNACGICRVGGRDNYFHCHRCGCCYVKNLQDNHKCVENSMRQNCPVCFEYLFDSTMPTAVLPCGHTIHSSCLQEMERNGQLGCPICLKSYANLSAVWARMDEEIAATPMPAFYQGYHAQIACNDCNQASRVPFHAFGLKCPFEECGSYNTRRLALERPAGAPEFDTPGPDAVAANGNAVANGVANGDAEHMADEAHEPHIAELAALAALEPLMAEAAAHLGQHEGADPMGDAAHDADPVAEAALAAMTAHLAQNAAALVTDNPQEGGEEAVAAQHTAEDAAAFVLEDGEADGAGFE